MTSTPQQTTTGSPESPVVVLVSASWAGPSRPAPTVLRELSRRWGPSMLALLVEDPEGDVLEQWGIDMLPTWMRFRSAALEAAPDDAEERLTVSSLCGVTPNGERLLLEGPWTLTHRRTGALAKHVVETEFGPDSRH